jgi:hypothetical protein
MCSVCPHAPMGTPMGTSVHSLPINQGACVPAPRRPRRRYTAEDLLGTSFIKNAKQAKLLELLATVPNVGEDFGEPPHARLGHLPSDECVPQALLWSLQTGTRSVQPHPPMWLATAADIPCPTPTPYPLCTFSQRCPCARHVRCRTRRADVPAWYVHVAGVDSAPMMSGTCSPCFSLCVMYSYKFPALHQEPRGTSPSSARLASGLAVGLAVPQLLPGMRLR